GKVFSKVIEMLKECQTQNTITADGPSAQQGQSRGDPSGWSAMIEVKNAPGVEGSYRITTGGNPIRELSSIVSQMPNLAGRSFEDFKVHYENRSEMIFVGMTAAASDELNRMYLKALGWNAASRAYLQIDRSED